MGSVAAQVTDNGNHTKMDHKHAAASVPTATWDSDYSSRVWQVKWVTQGLTPVRPHVILTTATTLQPGKALALSMS